MTTITNNIKRFATPFLVLGIALTVSPIGALAQNGHMHTAPAPMPQDQQGDATTLISTVRAATERFSNVAVAEAEGYALQFGCVTGDEVGAMGLHYINGNIVGSGILDPTRPQIIIYEPIPGGGLKMTGVDFLVFADDWDKKNSAPPQLMGQLFHLFPSPNRFGLPAFYTLHVWAWKDNPNGAFTNWHPNVSCQSFAPKK